MVAIATRQITLQMLDRPLFVKIIPRFINELCDSNYFRFRISVIEIKHAFLAFNDFTFAN